MTTIATCSNDAEAELLKSLLEANGIEAFLPDDAGLGLTGSNIRLQVNDADAEEARRILAEAETAEAADEDEED